MEINKREELVDIFLSFMKEQIEKFGYDISSCYFDFTPANTIPYFNREPDNVPDSEDLIGFKKITSITTDDFKFIFNYCMTNQYIKRYSLGGGCEYKIFLTEEGFYKAKKSEEEIIYQNKLQKELIYIETYKSKDSDVNKLMLEAKKNFLDDNIQIALEKIWDAMERVKSLEHSDKKQSVNIICSKLGNEIESKFFDTEYQTLTNLGNSYQIRHFEKDKKPIINNETRKYLFFRVLSIVNLTLNKVK